MDSMSGGCGDPLPFLLLAGHVTAGADPCRDLGVLADLIGPRRHPQIQLAHTGEHRLLVAVVTTEGVVLRAREPLERVRHDVAAGAEGVVVLHVRPAHRAESRRADRHERGGGHKTDLDAALACLDPGDDLQAAAPQVDDEPRGDRQADKEAADLEPLREVKEEA